MNKSLSTLLAAFFLLAAVSPWFTPAGCQETKAATSAGVTGPGVPMEGTYIIGKGDVLAIDVWNEPVLSREVIVRMDGMISLPLIDDVLAAGRTPMALKRDIQARLTEYIEGTEVTVTYKSSQHQKFYLLGEISSPGEYDLQKDLTILQGFALAGGFTEWADQDDIILIRRRGTKEFRFILNYKDMIKGKAPLQNFLIQPGDTIIVPY